MGAHGSSPRDAAAGARIVIAMVADRRRVAEHVAW